MVIHRRRRGGWGGVAYLHYALKLLAIVGLIGATHHDPYHAYVYVPAIVAVACSNLVRAGR